jgi:hypothetical protein
MQLNAACYIDNHELDFPFAFITLLWPSSLCSVDKATPPQVS